ncbi:MAG: YbaB/EbfC family nucleoid-associated protein [Flavobacteriia bacterium]|nr:YbaB/EbfC family nucleoid-associated protein [Flavobacteriia bacterium]
MFGNLMDMMGKFQSAQKNFEDLKNRLDSSSFTQTSADGTVSITLTELATIKDIQIATGLLADKEELEDKLIVTLNQALEKVKKNAVDEAKRTAKDSLPPIPGL